MGRASLQKAVSFVDNKRNYFKDSRILPEVNQNQSKCPRGSSLVGQPHLWGAPRILTFMNMSLTVLHLHLTVLVLCGNVGDRVQHCATFFLYSVPMKAFCGQRASVHCPPQRRAINYVGVARYFMLLRVSIIKEENVFR